MAPSTYQGVRGQGLRYLGDLNPTDNINDHWGGYPLVRFGWNDWVFLLESTVDDHTSTMYYRNGNPFDFDGAANDGQPGPDPSAFGPANTVWKESDYCDTRLAGLTYVPDPNGQRILYGFVSWNGRKIDSNMDCEYGYNGLFRQVKHVVFNFDTKQYKINGTWHNFGTEFPIDPSSESPSNTYKGSWDIADTPWGYYAFRSVFTGGTGSTTETPPWCQDPNHWATNLDLPFKIGGKVIDDYLSLQESTLEYAKVDPISGTLLTGWTRATSPWLPSNNRNGASHGGIGSWSHGTYVYQASNELATCWTSPLVDWNPLSGSSSMTNDWTP